MEIRRSCPADASQIASLEAEIFTDPWNRADIVSTISTEGSMCYSAISDGKIIGYILGRQIPPEGEIYRIATHPEMRRRGIAYRLLDYAVKTERGVGLEDLFLEVREGNHAARGLYEAYGFRPIGKRKNYYKNPTDDAIVMAYLGGKGGEE
jgi:ribosomal-protein-alanine N-acetyltransferase